MTMKKYSDQIIDWLTECGYTHCFFVAGGNIMHLLDSVRTRMECVPFVHEVGAVIAAEYFNASNSDRRALALVTAGPGLTNAVTGIAGAWQESRELLVIGGQVKSADLANGQVRQRGIQEIDGVRIVESITKVSQLLDKPISKDKFNSIINQGKSGRMGPVFLEICLDVQAADPLPEVQGTEILNFDTAPISEQHIQSVRTLISESKRPLILFGGGVKRSMVDQCMNQIESTGIPIQTTWNGADRFPSDNSLYSGRPDTWGQRAANLIIQQCDLLIAIGARLSLQQTGFAWEEFAPLAKIVQIEIDRAEIEKGHPRIDLGICGDANDFISKLFDSNIETQDIREWKEFISETIELLPLNDSENQTSKGYVDPYLLGSTICSLLGPNDIVLPCSSGGAATVSMQTFQLTAHQQLIGNKSLASMGYGLSGAIGASLANPDSTVVLNEGDGGFAQNLQELGTLAATNANVKLLIWSNHGYASIRMTQRNYFGGAWIGCDKETGLGLPNLKNLASTYGIRYHLMQAAFTKDDEFMSILNQKGPAIIEVPIDPEQTFYPKITSRVLDDGSMASNPLHLMSPELSASVANKVLRYIKK